jgi:hypothetical protein
MAPKHYFGFLAAAIILLALVLLSLSIQVKQE